MRLLGVLLLALVVVPAVPAVSAVGAGRASGPVLAPPVPGRVVAGFDAPTRYGPGHRGVDLAAPLGSPVRAAAAGRVTFAGQVVDATWVTVDHGALRTTVGPLHSVRVRRGQAVDVGTVLGTSGRAHGRPGVHWSARRGEVYVDPLGMVGAVATLLPRGATASPASWPRARVR